MTDILVPSNKTLFVTDATLLSAIMKCGRFTDITINQQLQSVNGKSNSLETGSIVHKYLEVYYNSKKNGLSSSQSHGFGMTAAELYIQGCPHCTAFEPITVCPCNDGAGPSRQDCHICEGKGEVLKPKCNHKPNDYPGVQNTPAEPDKEQTYLIGWKYVLNTCEQYYEFYKNDYWVTLETEIVKSKIMYEDDDVKILFKSKLDWIVDTNTGIFPCDHKTMKQNRDSVSLNNQFMGQCLIMDTRNVYINKIGFQKTLKPEEKFKRISVSYSAARLFEWQSQILPYWVKTALMYNEQGYWPPNFSNCDGKFGFCILKSVCESNPDMRGEELRNNFVVGPLWNPINSED